MREHRKARIGRVVSNKMDKTVVVAVDTRRPHPLYRRVITSTNRFKAHDETNRCLVGDVVRILETRPLSKQKRWEVTSVLRRGAEVALQPLDLDLEGQDGVPPEVMKT